MLFADEETVLLVKALNNATVAIIIVLFAIFLCLVSAAYSLQRIMYMLRRKEMEEDLLDLVETYTKTPPLSPIGRDWRQEQKQLDEEAEYQAEVQASMNQHAKAFTGASPEEVALAAQQLKTQEAMQCVTVSAFRRDWPAPLTVCHRPVNYHNRPWETGRCDMNCDVDNAVRLVSEYRAAGYDVKVTDGRDRDITHLIGSVGPWSVVYRDDGNDLWSSESGKTRLHSAAEVVATANAYMSTGRYVMIVDGFGNNVTEAFVLQERGEKKPRWDRLHVQIHTDKGPVPWRTFTSQSYEDAVALFQKHAAYCVKVIDTDGKDVTEAFVNSINQRKSVLPCNPNHGPRRY